MISAMPERVIPARSAGGNSSVGLKFLLSLVEGREGYFY